MYESLEYPLSELLLGLSVLLLYELFTVSDAEEDSGLLYTGADFLPDVLLDADVLLDPDVLLTVLLLLLTELLVPMPLRTVTVLLPALDDPE